MPYALWVPFIWIGINASRALAYWFSSGTAASEATDISEGSFIDRNVYLFLIAVGMVILMRRRIEWGKVIINCRWLLALYAYYLLSVAWSENPFVAFKRWFKDAGDIVVILVILTEKEPVDAIRAAFIRCAYLLVPLSVLFIKWYPTLGRYTHRYTYQTYYCGITTNKNALGVLAMLSGLFLLWQIVEVYRQRGRTLANIWPDLVVLSMCVWLLNLAGSVTASSCFFLGVLILFLTRLQWFRTNLMSLGWSVAGIAVLMLAFTLSPGVRGVVAGVLGRDVTLTDRTLIWEEALKANTNPIIGCGFDSFWLTSKANVLIEVFHVPHSHNGYLETYLNTGWIGVVLLLVMLFSAGQNVVAQFSRGRLIGYLFMMIFWSGLVFNYTEVAFSRSNVLGLLFSLMAAYGIVVPPKTPLEARIVTDQCNAEWPVNFPPVGEYENEPRMSNIWSGLRIAHRSAVAE